MADEVSSTVKTTSDGKVKITVEKYQELLAAAAEKAPVIYNTIQKTPLMQAKDNKVCGQIFMATGASLFVIGAFVFRTGKLQMKELKDLKLESVS